jgi:MarR family transcriptional regulator for hemolysin
MRSFGFLLKDLSRLHTRRFEERARSFSLTLSQCKVLVYLARHEGVSQARLCELTELEPMSLVRILDHMEAAGWLERRADPVDRRARRLFLKAKSAPLVDEIWSISDALRAEAFAGVTPQQAKLLITLLEKMHQNMLALEPLPDQLAPAAGSKLIHGKTTSTRAHRARATVKS